MKKAPKQLIQRRSLQIILIKGLDKYENKCVDEEFDINVSQRGNGSVGPYEDWNVMMNWTKLETKNILRNRFYCSALDNSAKFALNNTEISSWGTKTCICRC